MSDTSTTSTTSTTLPETRASLSALTVWFTRRRLLILGAMMLIGGGMALNWGWLAAVGAAPLILALAPCAVMCGLGLCMKGGAGKTCAKDDGTRS
ncbi:hypothetical protein [Jannaschia helgolandensis]|uniref:hypothetical protein n=1 Tax=Jannaschia helgolandensis TaxID=188906 RepID=UPI000B8122E4|nr:hypothetical protein [Jannaschia helgolandensis]